METLDVDTAYLNSVMKEELYAQLPEEFQPEDPPTKFPIIRKSLFGSKQAGTNRYELLTKFLINIDWNTSRPETIMSVYVLTPSYPLICSGREKKWRPRNWSMLSTKISLQWLECLCALVRWCCEKEADAVRKNGSNIKDPKGDETIESKNEGQS